MTDHEKQVEDSLLARLIREARERKYRTAKEFWELCSAELKVSYPHYSTVESGKKFPDIELTIAIAKTLKLDLRTVCHIWARDQMPDAATRAYFEPIPGREIAGMPAMIKDPLDDFYVFTERQAEGFLKYPHLWDIISFIMAFGLDRNLTEADLSENLCITSDEVSETVDYLRNQGLVIVENKRLIPQRKYYHIPNTEPFRKIRDQNFFNAVNDLVPKLASKDLASKEAYRTVFMRRMTKTQAQSISKHIDDLIGHAGNLDEIGQEFYTLAIAFGSRAHFSKQSGAV